MNASKIVGWVLTGLLVVLYGMSATYKFVKTDDVAKDLKIGGQIVIAIGIAEMVSAILFAIPRTSFVGAILLTGYMGGAIMSHVGKEEAVVFQALIGVLIWVALGLRQREIFQLALGNPVVPEPEDEPTAAS